MSTGKRRIFEPAFKLSIVQRVMAGESAKALSRELQIRSSTLSRWCAHFRRGGADGLRRAGRPHKIPGAVQLDPATKAMQVKDLAAARNRITALERKIGQQQVELDFFQKALRQVGQARRPNDGPGVPTSTPSSRR
jgi:transposase